MNDPQIPVSITDTCEICVAKTNEIPLQHNGREKAQNQERVKIASMKLDTIGVHFTDSLTFFSAAKHKNYISKKAFKVSVSIKM